MAPLSFAASILDFFPGLGAIQKIDALAGAGGFSGSIIFQVHCDAGLFCLKGWSEETSPRRLAWIHQVVSSAGRHLIFVPIPRTAADGATFVNLAGRLWELTPWLPGRADFQANPTPTRLAAAMHALAKFHLTVAPLAPAQAAPSQALLSRSGQLQELLHGKLLTLECAVRKEPNHALFPLADELLRLFTTVAPSVAGELSQIVTMVTPLQIAIRDVWHDHLLFTGDELTGLIDYGALRIESPVGDLARLLGSLVQDDRDAWLFAIQEYQTLAPLSADQQRLLSAFDHSGTLLSGISWLTWLFLEKRVFDDHSKIAARLRKNIARLRHLSIVPAISNGAADIARPGCRA